MTNDQINFFSHSLLVVVKHDIKKYDVRKWGPTSTNLQESDRDGCSLEMNVSEDNATMVIIHAPNLAI